MWFNISVMLRNRSCILYKVFLVLFLYFVFYLGYFKKFLELLVFLIFKGNSGIFFIFFKRILIMYRLFNYEVCYCKVGSISKFSYWVRLIFNIRMIILVCRKFLYIIF